VFTGFVLFELARLDFIRREYGQDWSTNKKLILVIALIIMLQISIISFPITRRWFNVSLLNITDYLIIITTGIIMYLIFIAVDKIKDRMIESDFKIIKVLKKHL
ncbi:cation transporting ATPase C-terminal domain-containing protein, partial [Candidatus Micrarchaeota archaeon]|nr:cation transporting ATPase C-terminal domain-containing protein [Candidatus Micrarchaeota archaeon]